MEDKKSKFFVFYVEIIFKDGTKSQFGIQPNIWGKYKLSKYRTAGIWYEYSDYEYVDFTHTKKLSNSAIKYKAKDFGDYVYKSLSFYRNIFKKGLSSIYPNDVRTVKVKFTKANTKELNFRVPLRDIQRLTGFVPKYKGCVHSRRLYDVPIFYNEPLK